ncbi:aminotransferase class I/II-fold pyridoxal phosphate-dependent enzyme [Legionella gresilensis]|uniref:aminotransferase class I/II-fold pyridoxal phosphate-dependent enzyme n=1 Tax=Legionella gresilensis TaxID=91823 RepID=UPI0010419B88|nr:aminotransferase class I/II-fold pyridoxal phosphate-dependent enzyme [Legionella gresilensis]
MPLKTISDIFENSDRLQLGTVRTKCQMNKITSVNEIAKAYEYVKHKLLQAKEWGYENFTDMGSNASGLIRSDASPDIEKECIIWSINHYFGLNRHPEVIQSAMKALQEYGTGSGTSAMSGGHSSLHKQLEKRLAEVMKKEAAILFSTGFTANFGALSALGKSGKALFLLDQECHASIFDGVKVTGCNYLLFKHNDINELERFLTKNAGEYDNIFVLVESVYSMSGEEAPLKEIIEMKKKYPFYLFVDEAHGFGLYDVGGLCSQLGLSKEVDFIVTTLSKSVASVGGVVACNQQFKTFFQVEATAYMFQAAMTPADVSTALTALNIIEREPKLQQEIWEKTAYFRQGLISKGFDTGKGTSPIISMYIRNIDLLYQFSKLLFEQGIFVTPITYPAVSPSEVRFRFIVNNGHTYEQIDYTLNVLTIIGKELGVI